MSKFCENCGSELKDTDKVCPNCGAAAVEKTTKKDVKVEKNTATNAESNTPNNTKKIAIIAGIAVAAILVIILLISLLGSGYKTPLNNYFKGIEKAKSETYLKAYPEFVREEMEDTYDDEYLEKRVETFEKEYGDKIKISYKVLDKEKLDKDDLEDIQDELEDDYDEDDVKVSTGYEVAVKITVKGSDDKESYYSSFYICKVNGKWCMVD